MNKTLLIFPLILASKILFAGERIDEKINIFERTTGTALSSLNKADQKCITNSLNAMVGDFVEIEERTNGKYFNFIKTDCIQEVSINSTKSSKNRKKSRVKVIGNFNFSTNQLYSGEKLGGLSGLTYNLKSNEMTIISDDFGRFGTPRFFKFNLDYKHRKFNFNFKETIKIKDKENNVLEYTGYSSGFDSEGIIDLGEKDGFLVSTETFFDNSFLHHIKSGKIVGKLSIPQTYNLHTINKYQGTYSLDSTFNLPSTRKPSKYCKTLYVLKLEKWDCDLIKRNNIWLKRTKVNIVQNPEVTQYTGGGIAHNLGIEALTISPSKQSIFFSTERSLKQDNPQYDFEYDYTERSDEEYKNANLVRIVAYKKRKNTFSLNDRKEFAYQFEKRKGNGISEILAITDNKLLVMERGFNSKTRKTTVKIFEVNLNRAKDIKDRRTLKDLNSSLVLKKKLLVDLDEVKHDFNAGFRVVDNFEAMALGPKLKNGRSSIILASDNNFRGAQLTQIIILQLPFSYR